MNEAQVQKALNYIIDNPTLSFHHVAVKFGVFVGDLQNAYTKYQQEKRKCANHTTN